MASSRKRVPETNPGASNPDGSPQAKKHKNVRAKLMPDTIEWPLNNRLWPVIGDLASEAYLKSQPSIDDYVLTVKRFLTRLSLVIRSLNRDQVMVVFRTTVLNWYSTAEKANKLRTSELFESAHTWVETYLINKLYSYSRLWYKLAAGTKYYKDWHHAK